MSRKRRPITFSYLQKRAIDAALETAVNLYERFLMQEEFELNEFTDRGHRDLKNALATFQYKTKHIKKPKKRCKRRLT